MLISHMKYILELCELHFHVKRVMNKGMLCHVSFINVCM